MDAQTLVRRCNPPKFCYERRPLRDLQSRPSRLIDVSTDMTPSNCILHSASNHLQAIPQTEDHNNAKSSNNWFKVILAMPHRNGLILRIDGKIKIKQIMAIDINNAIAKGKVESSDLKGIVYSDQNDASSM